MRNAIHVGFEMLHSTWHALNDGLKMTVSKVLMTDVAQHGEYIARISSLSLVIISSSCSK